MCDVLRRDTRTQILCDERPDAFAVNRVLQVHDTHAHTSGYRRERFSTTGT